MELFLYGLSPRGQVDVKEIPFVLWVLIIITSIIGGFTDFFDSHLTIKLAPDPPVFLYMH
jgi:hypothetical protein